MNYSEDIRIETGSGSETCGLHIGDGDCICMKPGWSGEPCPGCAQPAEHDYIDENDEYTVAVCARHLATAREMADRERLHYAELRIAGLA